MWAFDDPFWRQKFKIAHELNGSDGISPLSLPEQCQIKVSEFLLCTHISDMSHQMSEQRLAC